MTTRTSTTARGTQSGAWVRRLAVAAEACGRVITALRHRREIRRLAEFDERMLKDIGLTRSDVIAALSEPYHQDPSRRILVRRVDRRARERAVALKAAEPCDCVHTP